MPIPHSVPRCPSSVALHGADSTAHTLPCRGHRTPSTVATCIALAGPRADRGWRFQAVSTALAQADTTHTCVTHITPGSRGPALCTSTHMNVILPRLWPLAHSQHASLAQHDRSHIAAGTPVSLWPRAAPRLHLALLDPRPEWDGLRRGTPKNTTLTHPPKATHEPTLAAPARVHHAGCRIESNY